MTRARTIVGFAVAPLATSVAVPVICLVGWALHLGALRHQPLAVVAADLGSTALSATLLAYISIIVFGIPAFILATRLRVPALGETALLGALLGALGAVLTAFLGNWEALSWIFPASTSGVLTSAVFWFVALRNRQRAPNSALQPTPTRAK